MQAVRTNWEPRNLITTPLTGEPIFINSGIIKAVMSSGEKISVGQIDYQEFDEENFQYIISPYWEIIDGLPADVFQGIPGIDMSLRLKDYYRINYIPTFIAERTPSEGREDLWELLEQVGLDYYDRFEWLLRTSMRSANDNLIVERRRIEPVVQDFIPDVISNLQYGDKIIIDSIESIATTASAFSEKIFQVLVTGVDIVDKSGEEIIESTARTAMIPIEILKRKMEKKEYQARRRDGIESAKRDGKYLGRKPVEVDENTLRQVKYELENDIITVEEAAKRVGVSKSTFYRRLKKLENS